jgi:hypothetical protein
LLWACNVSQLFVDGFPQLLFLFIHLYLKHVGNVPMVVPMLHVWCVSHQSKPIIRYLEGIHPYTICFGVYEGTRVLTHTCVGVSSMIYIHIMIYVYTIYTYIYIYVYIYTCFAEHIRACSQEVTLQFLTFSTCDGMIQPVSHRQVFHAAKRGTCGCLACLVGFPVLGLLVCQLFPKTEFSN